MHASPPKFHPTKLIVIGLGNELLSDDGLGIRVVRALKGDLTSRDITFEELCVGGLQLLDFIIGYDECIIVDAIVTGMHPPGTICRFVQTPDGDPVSLTSSHQIDLAHMLVLGKLLGAALPARVTVYGIEAEDVTLFRESCTDPVSKAIPQLIDCIRKDIIEGPDAAATRTGEWQIIHDIVTS